MNNKIQVIDDFLEPEEFKELENRFFSADENGLMHMSWHTSWGVNHSSDDYFQFNHTFYLDNAPQSDQSDIIIPIIRKIPNLLSFIRIKANLLTRTQKHDFHGYHVDVLNVQGLPHKTAIFYCNTTNGWTQFENGKKVECIGNRMVIFDGQLEHSSVSQTDEPFRVVINFVYIEEDFGVDNMEEPATLAV